MKAFARGFFSSSNGRSNHDGISSTGNAFTYVSSCDDSTITTKGTLTAANIKSNNAQVKSIASKEISPSARKQEQTQ